ncbi:hypothetical protein H0X32_02035 [Patescibacteria group bacterium]|nr:hypothetical protein [Patescibacteria group bacterium]
MKIYGIGVNFKSNFLGKIEDATRAETLKISKLKKASVDGPIMTETGEMTTETTVGQFWEQLKQQGNGQSGPLLVNGYANIAYIRDQNEVLWAVDAGWDSSHAGTWGRAPLRTRSSGTPTIRSFPVDSSQLDSWRFSLCTSEPLPLCRHWIRGFVFKYSLVLEALMIGVFAIRWLSLKRTQALCIIAIQIVAVLAGVFPVFYFHL